MGQNPNNSRGRDRLDQQPPLGETFKVLAVCCFLLLTVLLVFGQAYQFEFIVCDDDPYVYGNPHVIDGLSQKASSADPKEKVWRGWRDNPLWWCLTSDHAGNWHPLTWFSHVLDAEMYGIHDMPPSHFFGPGTPERWRGPEAGGHHFTSVLLHAAAAIVLFLALRRMTGAFWCSALVAAMFALHPLRAESVAWVAERKDVLSGLFWMLTLFAYGGYCLRPSIGRYLAVMAVFALGLTAKSMLVTLPCVLLLLDFWPLRRWQPRQLSPGPTEQSPSRFAPQSIGWLVVEKLPLLALSAAVCVIVVIIQQNMGCMTMTDSVPMDCRIANAAFSCAAYLWKTIWPLHLAIFYPHLAVMGADEAQKIALQTRLISYGIGAAVLLAVITLFVLWNLRRRPYLAVGWFWYLGTLVPVIGLIQVGAQGMADRYTYLPTIGVTIMVVWGGAELAARSSRLRMTLSIAAGIVLATWTVFTFCQVATWETSVTVFQHAIDVTNDNYFAHNHLALAYQNDVRNLAAAGKKAAAKDLETKAGEEFEEAVRLGPSYDASNANLGVYYMNTKQLKKALVCFENAVRVNYRAAFHHANLATAYGMLDRFDDAAAQYREAIDIEPKTARYHQALAGILFRQGKAPAALAELYKVLDLSPNDPGTMTNIAWHLATSYDASIRDGKKSLELAQRATELTNRKYPLALNALAAAYAETGRFEDATDTASEALTLAAQQNNQGFVALAKEAIRVYASGSPFRQPPPKPATDPAPSP